MVISTMVQQAEEKLTILSQHVCLDRDEDCLEIVRDGLRCRMCCMGPGAWLLPVHGLRPPFTVRLDGYQSGRTWILRITDQMTGESRCLCRTLEFWAYFRESTAALALLSQERQEWARREAKEPGHAILAAKPTMDTPKRVRMAPNREWSIQRSEAGAAE